MNLDNLSDAEREALERLYVSSDPASKRVAGKIKNDPKWPRDGSDMMPLLGSSDSDARMLGIYLARLLRGDA